ncbi:MAG: bifunctional UDP-N-acetylglucosamine diphosphorylase/glucosamine-1-phosphate N-acetyltransferase GlmU [Candidatus Izemoplasmataceae bacterium]|jgi:bifunctional UDP-N-acetylglucosamine pyrophosphorylase / glucosamine-1-phosphate N-acetyltransferase
MKTFALVLAAGKGTRMKTELPKCAFPILKKPMIEYIVENIERSQIEETVLVVGHKKEVFEDMLDARVRFAYQLEQLGTGHAALSARSILENKVGTTLILLGDMPLINDKVIDKIITTHEMSENDLTVVTTNFENPKGYGRIIRDEYGHIASIIEHNDCTYEQKQIKEVNTGIYAVNNKYLYEILPKIEKNPRKGEYYLTDIVSLMKEHYKVGTFVMRDNYRVMGVNDLYAISVAEKYLRDEINKFHMLNGVSIINPDTVTIGHNVSIEENVTISPNTTITGNSIIRTGSQIGPNTEIHNAVVYEDVTIKHSLVYDSTIYERSTIGPFAHLRNNAVIGRDNRIGNFVEIKKSTTGANTKAAHLAYIGDTTTGKNVNFGCGSITVNYDGVEKHQTIIGDDVFIGCNTNLIAPIKIEDQVFIAAGSTVTKDVPKGALAIARNHQINKADYAKHLVRPKNDEK